MSDPYRKPLACRSLHRWIFGTVPAIRVALMSWLTAAERCVGVVQSNLIGVIFYPSGDIIVFGR